MYLTRSLRQTTDTYNLKLVTWKLPGSHIVPPREPTGKSIRKTTRQIKRWYQELRCLVQSVQLAADMVQQASLSSITKTVQPG